MRCKWLCEAACDSRLTTPQRQQAQVQRASRTEQRRHLHKVPQLQHGSQLDEKGIAGLYSPGAFRMAWHEEMNFLISKLNALTASMISSPSLTSLLLTQDTDTPEENKDTKTLLIQFARDPNNAALFNYASMAHNIHFHFTSLNPLADSQTAPALPSALVTEIQKDFSSTDDLRQTFLDTADSMFGPGFVWLVRAKTPAPPGTGERERYRMRVLCTYLAGSPYAGAHYRAQRTDMNTQDSQLYRDAARRGLSGPEFMRQTSIQSGAGSFGLASRFGLEKKVSRGGVELEPLLCVNMWEHAWMRDWGIYQPNSEGQWISGKRRYLETWWRTVDWEGVWRRCESSVGQERDDSRRRAGSNMFSY